MKSISNEEYICKVFEETFVYDKRINKIQSGVAIVERAECDLFQLIELWENPDIPLQEMKIEEFSEEKALYIAFQTMCALDYLH